MTDDEILRTQAMTDGPKKIGKFTLRPMGVETLAWMQTCGVFDEDLGNVHKLAAFVAIHTTDKKTMLPLVFNRRNFWLFMNDWLTSNISHHSELTPYEEEFERGWEAYQASVTTALHPNEGKQDGTKN